MSEQPAWLAGAPASDVVVPPKILELAGGDPLRPVWENVLGGLTFEVGTGEARRFMKWAGASTGIDLVAEAQRMRWVARFSRVPPVVDAGRCTTGGDAMAGTWLVTRPLRGDSAVSDRWKAEPATAVAAIASGLRFLHDHAPIDGCPFTWAVADRVAVARQRAAMGASRPALWHRDHQALSLDAALAIAADPPPPDRLVVCHGDACLPNTIIGDDGGWAGHVDLSKLGVADRWADLAVGSWSLEWNYGPGWSGLYFGTYGIEPDADRLAYYRLLWDLT